MAAKFVDGAGNELLVPEHVFKNTVFSIGCGRYTPDCELPLEFTVPGGKEHEGITAMGTFYCDSTGAGAGVRGFLGGTGYKEGGVKIRISASPAERGRVCRLSAVLAPRDAGAPKGAGRPIAQVLLTPPAKSELRVANISARSSMRLEPMPPLCAGWRDGEKCRWPLRYLREESRVGPDGRKSYHMDEWLSELSDVPVFTCEGEVCTEWSASEHGTLDAAVDLSATASGSGTVPANHQDRAAVLCPRPKAGLRGRDHHEGCKVDTMVQRALLSSAAHGISVLRVGGHAQLQQQGQVYVPLRAAEAMRDALQEFVQAQQPSLRGAGGAAFEARAASPALAQPVLAASRKLGVLAGRVRSKLTRQRLGNCSIRAAACATPNTDALGDWDHAVRCSQRVVAELDDVFAQVARQGVGASGALSGGVATRIAVCRALQRVDWLEAHVPHDERPICRPFDRSLLPRCGTLALDVTKGDTKFFLALQVRG